MKKRALKHKKWNEHKSRKQLKRLSRIKKRQRRIRSPRKSRTFLDDRAKNRYMLHAPEQMGLLNDSSHVTIEFFDRAIRTIQKCTVGDGLYFDFEKVTYISADVVMYVIALISNYKRLNMLNIHVGGNLPNDKEARKYIEDIGFYNYVRGLKKSGTASKNRFRISQGEQADSELAGILCDFALEESRVEGITTKRLYPMIIELMTNTCQHAYKKGETSKMKSNWYVFAERTNSFVHFVFLDTGIGIPSTISRSLLERGGNIVNRKDAEFIASALRGEKRTETKESFRGKGLPGIYQDASSQNILNLSIISGKGKCMVASGGNIIKSVLEHNFEGTLFTWDFKIA